MLHKIRVSCLALVVSAVVAARAEACGGATTVVAAPLTVTTFVPTAIVALATPTVVQQTVVKQQIVKQQVVRPRLLPRHTVRTVIRSRF